jgi:predicted Zn-dependent protease
VSARGDRPARLEDRSRMLTREEVATIVQRVQGFAVRQREVMVMVYNWWTGELRWGRNRVSLASDRRNVTVEVVHKSPTSGLSVTRTNQVDDESLRAVVRAAERNTSAFGDREVTADLELPVPALDYPKVTIWSDPTYDLTTEARGSVARSVVDPAELQQMLSAGYLEMRGYGVGLALPGRDFLYGVATQAQCSMTVRDQKGTGSGWAGLSGYNWSAIDSSALVERALQKALASRNPVALEPGRYTVILEPQAVHDLVSPIVDYSLNREDAEAGGGPFTLGAAPGLKLNRTKLGLKVVDERVTIGQDPADPRLGVIPFSMNGDPNRVVNWIEGGVLTNLSTARGYALHRLNENLGYPNSLSFRMSGGDTSLEAMIKSTKRGLLVTRLSNLRVLDTHSLLSTGLTRDGLWLIENGEITKAVKNFRFTESPLFVLNSIEQLGPPMPVFRPADPKLARYGVTPALVPPLKARDFSFTSLIDAV